MATIGTLLLLSNIASAEDTISPTPQPQEVQLTLYYPAEKGSLLVPEVRKAVKSGKRLEEVVLSELLKGPETKGLRPVVPGGVRAQIPGLKVFDGRADVHVLWREGEKPSTTELDLFVWSIVNTLTELPHIKRVELRVTFWQPSGTEKQLIDAVFERDESRIAKQ